MAATRPWSILWAERLVLLVTAARLAGLLWQNDIDRVRAAAADAAIAPGVGIAVMLCGILIPLLLMMLATRCAGRISAWAFAVWTALLAAGFFVAIVMGFFVFGPHTLASAAILAAYTLVTVQLFRPDARRWFRGEPDPAEIADVFA